MPDRQRVRPLAPTSPWKARPTFPFTLSVATRPLKSRYIKFISPQDSVDPEIYKPPDFKSVHSQVKSERETIRIDADLASSLTPSELRPGVAVATVTGDLRAKNNK